MEMRGFEVVVGERGEEVVEGVEADREREEEERERILPGEVAGVEDVVLDRDRRSVSLEMVIGQLPLLALMVAYTIFGLWILSLPLG